MRDVQAFGRSLTAFEIGNEPNVYNVIAAYHTPSGAPVLTRPPSFGYPEYLEPVSRDRRPGCRR